MSASEPIVVDSDSDSDVSATLALLARLTPQVMIVDDPTPQIVLPGGHACIACHGSYQHARNSSCNTAAHGHVPAPHL